ncbi:MAG: DUF541 domain-containing protein [Betaproteobacteria bacterium]|nr:DUF541 domain-containing protein [Betaproteobacteria bacterium]
MRRISIAMLVTSALVLAGCGETVNIGENGVPQGITVQATGTADVVPDAVRLSLSVSVMADTSEAALSAVATSADAVRAALQNAGIDDADIATQTLAVNPEYTYTDAEGQKLIGYRATQVFDVLVRDAEGAGAVVDAVVRAGGDAVAVNSTTPVVDDATDGATTARKDAVEKARAKAEEYAELLGVELGDLVYLTELSAPTNVILAAKSDAVSSESAGSVVDLGTQEVTVTVEARWQLG